MTAPAAWWLLPGPWAWLALGVAVWACGGPRIDRAAGRQSATDSGPPVSVDPGATPRRVPTPVLGAVAVVAVLACCLALGGLVAGGVLAGALAPAAWAVTRCLAGRRPPDRPDPRLPAALDLAAAALRAGVPVSTALRLAAPAASPPARAHLTRVAGLLALGADPAEAWAGLADAGPLAPVAAAARRSADSGVRLADGWERVAAQVRDQVRAEAERRAHRAGVFALAPLGACFLPSFVCLGVVPVIIGVARTVHGSLLP